MSRLACFKAYDVRGRVGVDLDADVVRRIGRAFVRQLGAGTVVIGRDARASSPALLDALAQGIAEEGAQAIDIGLCGTEEVYHATVDLKAEGGAMVTASHNPIDWNGLKMVREGARPIAWETGLSAIHDRVVCGVVEGPSPAPGGRTRLDARPSYAAHVAGYLDPMGLRPLRILVNAGNGAAGPTFDALARVLAARGVPIDWVRMDWTPDGAFPNGVPNPLLPGNRARTARAVVESRCDLGLAWDGDFDRCFLFDEGGRFVDGEHMVALLARAFLAREPGAAIVHEPRVVWAIQAAVTEAGGRPIAVRTGHAHLKAAMRAHDAPYGGELSAHHYFREFAYCDSGMIPALLIAGLVARGPAPLSALVGDLRARFPSSGEINFAHPDPVAAIARFETTYADGAREVDRLDGLSLDFGAWRVNLRVSNTEGLLRLNVETRGDRALLDARVAELSAFLSRP